MTCARASPSKSPSTAPATWEPAVSCIDLFDLVADPAELRNVWAAPAYKRRRCAALVELLAAKDAARDDDDVSCPEAIKKGTALGRAAKRGTTVLELCGGALPSDSRRR